MEMCDGVAGARMALQRKRQRDIERIKGKEVGVSGGERASEEEENDYDDALSFTLRLGFSHHI